MLLTRFVVESLRFGPAELIQLVPDQQTKGVDHRAISSRAPGLEKTQKYTESQPTNQRMPYHSSHRNRTHQL